MFFAQNAKQHTKEKNTYANRKRTMTTTTTTTKGTHRLTGTEQVFRVASASHSKFAIITIMPTPASMAVISFSDCHNFVDSSSSSGMTDTVAM